MNVLVTGANGQLATCIKTLEHTNSDYNFIYKSALELDISNREDVWECFKKNAIDYCINCAAYTAVDNAESNREHAFKVNDSGAEILAKACNHFNSKLIHISTDFVFDGSSKRPYKETDDTNPLGVYGLSKLEGEKKIQNKLKQHFIIRTSWLYSEFGNNFLKTMLRLSETRNEIGVVSDQIGSPTYAMDLAHVIFKIIKDDGNAYGIYHYSNKGIVSWYDFATAIFEIKNKKIKVNPITTKDFPTPAERPKYSVLDKTKIEEVFKIEIPNWECSLKKAISNL